MQQVMPPGPRAGRSTTIPTLVRKPPAWPLKVFPKRRAAASAGLLSLLGIFAAGCPSRPAAKFDLCVLKGATIDQGCATSPDGVPLIDLGATAFGKQSSKVIAIHSTGQDGDPITLTELKLEGQSSLNLQLTAFTLTAAGEVPVQLPLTLYPPGSGKVSEVRARLTLTASTPGTVQLEDLKAATADDAVTIPVVGTALDRLKVPLTTSAACGASYSCKTETVDVCAHLPDLASGDDFTVRFDNIGSSWSNSHEMLVHFKKGTASTFTESTSGKKTNVTNLAYDGACGVFASSQYSGSDTDYFQAQTRISDISYGAL